MRRALAVLVALAAFVVSAGAASAAAPAALQLGPPQALADFAPRTIYVENTSTVISDALMQDTLPAFQEAVSQDFAPSWNTDANLVYVGARDAPVGAWTVSVTDDSTVFGALGYHDASTGTPFAVVFARTDVELGYSWEVTLTHELFEMLLDPYVHRAAQVGRRFYYLEDADPVEDEAFMYFRHSTTGQPVEISDFINEDWYRPDAPGPYDFTGRVRRPLQILRGGYAYVWSRGHWVEIDARGRRRSRSSPLGRASFYRP